MVHLSDGMNFDVVCVDVVDACREASSAASSFAGDESFFESIQVPA